MTHILLEKRETLIYYLIVWGVIAVLHFGIASFLIGLPWQSAAADALVFNGLYALIALSFWYPCQFLSLERRDAITTVLVNHLLGAAISSGIWIGLAYLMLVKLVLPSPAYLKLFITTLPWRFFIGTLFYLAMVAFYYLLIYYQNFHQKLIAESELQALVKDAELRTLKFQINPHFIFNSLNSINSLILSMPERASEMTVKLAEFMRATLSGNDHPLRTLEEELHTAHLYMDIEKVRFGDKICYSQTVADDCLKLMVPNMMLQPLFENAIKHGVYESLEPVGISLSGSCEKQFLVLELRNDMDSRTAPRRGAGVGLKNISHRLEILYGKSGLMKINKAERVFTVTIHIPQEEKHA